MSDGLPGGGPWIIPTDPQLTCRCPSVACSLCADALSIGGGDFAFTTDDPKEILAKAHADVLKEQSPYFEALMRGEWKESTERRSIVPGSCADQIVIQSFVKFLYHQHSDVTMAGLDGRQLWILAEHYQVQGLKDFLVAHTIKPWNRDAVMSFAEEWGCANELLTAISQSSSLDSA